MIGVTNISGAEANLANITLGLKMFLETMGFMEGGASIVNVRCGKLVVCVKATSMKKIAVGAVSAGRRSEVLFS